MPADVLYAVVFVSLVVGCSVWLGYSRWNPLSPLREPSIDKPVWPPESTLRTLSDCDGDEEDAEL